MTSDSTQVHDSSVHVENDIDANIPERINHRLSEATQILNEARKAEHKKLSSLSTNSSTVDVVVITGMFQA